MYEVREFRRLFPANEGRRTIPLMPLARLVPYRSRMRVVVVEGDADDAEETT